MSRRFTAEQALAKIMELQSDDDESIGDGDPSDMLDADYERAANSGSSSNDSEDDTATVLFLTKLSMRAIRLR